MLKIGVQSKNIIYDENPAEGFQRLAKAGFDCCDLSLNQYLTNTMLYHMEESGFFRRTSKELQDYFRPHRRAAKESGICINQMHMPYPAFIPGACESLNDFLWNEMAPKCMEICHFLECPNIVIHGFKLKDYYGSEQAEWEKTKEFIEYLAPMAKDMGITICMENLYNTFGDHIVEGPCCDAAKAAERIDEINRKFGAQVLGFCFDTGHANLTGLDMEAFLSVLGDRLKVLHIHDNDGVRDLHQMPFTFTKVRENTVSTDWEGFLRALARIRFDKVLSFETAPILDSFPAGMKQEVLGFIRQIGVYMAGEIGSKVSDRS